MAYFALIPYRPSQRRRQRDGGLSTMAEIWEGERWGQREIAGSSFTPSEGLREVVVFYSIRI